MMHEITGTRVPPQDLTLERGVLASMLLSREAVGKVVQAALTEDDLYATSHRMVFKAIMEVYNAGATPDILTVTERLRANGHLEAAGGPQYLAEMVSECASSPNPVDWVAALLRLSERRRVIVAASTILARACDLSDDEASAEAVQVMVEAVEQRTRSRVVKISGALSEFFTELDAIMAGHSVGLKTGYVELDESLGGLRGGDFVVVAGRPSMGKTALGLGIARSAAGAGSKTIIFSLEMNRGQLMQRLVARDAGLNLHSLRCGTLPQRDLPLISQAAGPLHELPLWIDDSPNISLPYLRAICNTIGPELVVIDYLQLMDGQVSSRENRTQEIGKLSRGLKGLAKEFNVPVIALSQLSRDCEKRSGEHRPQLSDLREGGDIEQDADVVMFCYRGEYYFPDKESLRGIGEIIIGKQRNGPTGIKNLAWRAHTASYENLETKQDDFYQGVD